MIFSPITWSLRDRLNQGQCPGGCLPTTINKMIAFLGSLSLVRIVLGKKAYQQYQQDPELYEYMATHQHTAF